MVPRTDSGSRVDSRDLSPTRFSCSFPHLLALDLVLSLFAPHGKVLCDSDIETSVSVNRHNIISYLSPCPHTSFRSDRETLVSVNLLNIVSYLSVRLLIRLGVSRI